MATKSIEAEVGRLRRSRNVVLFTDRATTLTGAALLAVTAAAWAGVLAQAGLLVGTGAMATGAGEMLPSAQFFDLAGALAFVGAWTVMMAAMMLPSASPLVLLYYKSARRQALAGARWRKGFDTALLVMGYLLMWGAFGVPVYLMHQALGWIAAADPTIAGYGPFGVAAVLAVAGLYQFTPLKRMCLRQCRSPLAFLMHRWRSGPAGALRLGVEHGSYCLGCCWGLMAVLVAAGAMGLLWVVTIALVVFAEKLLPGGERTARLTGLVLLGLAALALLRPDAAMVLRAPAM